MNNLYYNQIDNSNLEQKSLIDNFTKQYQNWDNESLSNKQIAISNFVHILSNRITHGENSYPTFFYEKDNAPLKNVQHYSIYFDNYNDKNLSNILIPNKKANDFPQMLVRECTYKNQDIISKHQLFFSLATEIITTYFFNSAEYRNLKWVEHDAPNFEIIDFLDDKENPIQNWPLDIPNYYLNDKFNKAKVLSSYFDNKATKIISERIPKYVNRMLNSFFADEMKKANEERINIVNKYKINLTENEKERRELKEQIFKKKKLFTLRAKEDPNFCNNELKKHINENNNAATLFNQKVATVTSLSNSYNDISEIKFDDADSNYFSNKNNIKLKL